jgi:hypothetical protein
MAAGLLLMAGPRPQARADGGTVQLSEVAAGLRVTVFTAPSPLRVGPIDVSVLVQDAATGLPIEEAIVTVQLNPRDRPGEVVSERATHAAATNKILQAASFPVAAPGQWRLRVLVEYSERPVQVQCPLEVAEGLPEWLALLPWVLWPLLPIALFLVHLQLVKRRERVRNCAVPNGET